MHSVANHIYIYIYIYMVSVFNPTEQLQSEFNNMIIKMFNWEQHAAISQESLICE